MTSPVQILVVDDEVIVAMDLAHMLEEMGHEVVGMAATAAQAIEFARQDRPDLILMDVRLRGDTDGLAAAREIHARWNIPSILVTAHGPDALQAGGVEAGIYGRVAKPYSRGEIRQCIIDWMQSR